MSRAAFEEWAKAPPREFDTRRLSEKCAWPGHYQYYHVQCCWEAWQAAEKATSQRCAEIADGADKSTHPSDLADAIRAEYPEAGK